MLPSNSDKTRRHRTSTSEAMKRVAICLQCPSCKRKMALKKTSDGDYFESRCRYCDWAQGGYVESQKGTNPMTTDAPGLREAAEHILSVIEAHDIATFDCDRRGDVYCDCLDKAKSRLRASLATHPSDGGEAISEEWLRGIGGEHSEAGLNEWIFSHNELKVSISRWGSEGWRAFAIGGGLSVFLRFVKEKDDLRHLLAALGCETKGKVE